MRRINLTIAEQLYEQTRWASFVTCRSVSDLLCEAMSEWFINHSLSKRGELMLVAAAEDEILAILENEDFEELEQVKSDLGI
ncbi:MAG: hypothetical protein HQ562_02030 [Candidatus Marinimicrobia bacterium]|nr:hypothetical protein [Candidatus Neomarinimicrobiota bacterium]